MCTSSTCIGMSGRFQLLQHKLAHGCMKLRSLPSGLNICGVHVLRHVCSLNITVEL